MASAHGELSGPDLTQGLAVSDLGDGDMIAGHAHDEPVLVARLGDEFFAVGAVCTHYGAPLGDGLLVGETVRCPWHHACFSLRTGEALRPPALDPLPRWRTERRDGRVFVVGRMNGEMGGGKDETADEAIARKLVGETGGDGAPATAVHTGRSSARETEPKAIVIVGAGAAGNTAAEVLRREGYGGRVTLIGAESDLPYDRPNLSKDYLAGTAPEEWVPLRSRDFYSDNGIDLVLGEPATALDLEAGRIHLGGGASVPFDRLLLATGAEPVRLSVPGGDLPHVHYLRSLSDSRAIIAGAADAKRAVVVGGSFIGLEVAAALRTRGVAVRVVAPDARPMERILGAEMGDFIRSVHEEHGVIFHLNERAVAIEPRFVALEGGDLLPADLVVIGVGVRPAVSLAEKAGLHVDNGVLVNEYLETGAPGVFAAGDVARWPHGRTGQRIRIEHWVVAQRMGQTAARNMLGRRERFDAVPFFWSRHYDIPINYVGYAPSWDDVDVVGSIQDLDCILTYRSGDRTAAVASIYRDRENLLAEAAMEQNALYASSNPGTTPEGYAAVNETYPKEQLSRSKA